MKNLKRTVFFSVLALIAFIGANMINSSAMAQYREHSPSTYPAYTVKSVSHNSKDPAYGSRGSYQVAPAKRVYASQPSAQKMAKVEDPYYNPKDGSMFPGGSCTRAKGQCFKACKSKCTSPMKGDCEKACKSCFTSCDTAKRSLEESCIAEPTCNPLTQDYIMAENNDIYQAIHGCGDLASLELKWVDFRLKNDRGAAEYSSKIGDYRFRLFGCRRYNEKVTLNTDRIMQKDLQFVRIFEDMVSDCYDIIKVPDDLCLYPNKPVPEYSLTAEITDFYMNMCDQYDWSAAEKSDLRSGASEMTVTWRLTDITGSMVYWKGESTGYGELAEGEYNGEAVLMERAFGDAVRALRADPSFEAQLAKRVPPQVIANQKKELIELQQIANPAMCQYQRPVQTMGMAPMCGIPCGFETCEVEEPMCDVPFVDEQAGFVEETSGFAGAGWMDVPLDEDCSEETKEVRQTFEDAFNNSYESLCIVDRPPYDKLTPENLYRVRASIVTITNGSGKSGSGLLLSDSFVLTSADLVTRENNSYNIETINGAKFKASAFRVNANKNTALLILDDKAYYAPLSLNLYLPAVGKSDFLNLGMMHHEGAEGWLENKAKVVGYRYSDNRDTEIVVDTDLQKATVGGALIDSHGTINGIAHTEIRAWDDKDLFLPITEALKSVGLEICGKAFPEQVPWFEKAETPIADIIDSYEVKAPEEMKAKERK